MRPSTIYLLRHAEKTTGSTPGPDLSPRGKSRAECLAFKAVHLFGKHPPGYVHLFATRPSKESSRPYDTLLPLSLKMGLKVRAKYADEDCAKLAAKLLKADWVESDVIIIAWHHGKLPELIHALGGDPNVRPIKDGKWDEDVFDRVILLKLEEGDVTTLSFPQKLLYGDASK